MKNKRLVTLSLVFLTGITIAGCGNSASSAAEATTDNDVSPSEATTNEKEVADAEETVISPSETETAYQTAANLTVYDAINYSDDLDAYSDGLKFNGLTILNTKDLQWAWDDYMDANAEKTFEDGALYRAMADCISEYYNNGLDGNWKQYYLDSPNTIFGMDETPTEENLQPYMEQVKDLFVQDDYGIAVLEKIESLSSVTTDYDYDAGVFDFSVPDISATASELGITEDAFGYTLAMMTEYLGETTFSGNSCTFHMENNAIGGQTYNYPADTSTEDLVSSAGLSEDEVALQMSNKNLSAPFLIENGWIYGVGTTDRITSVIKARTDWSDRTTLRKNAWPQNITIDGEYVYCLILDYEYGDKNENGNTYQNLFKARTSGSDGKTIIKHVDSYQICGDEIYYTKCAENDDLTEHYLYKCDLDGSSEEIALKEEVWFPYVIGNYLIYQCDDKNGDNGGERIDLYNFETGQQQELTDCRSYNPVLYGSKLFYICNKNEDRSADNAKNDTNILCCKDLGSGDVTELRENTFDFGIANGEIYFLNYDDSYRIYAMQPDGQNIRQITQDSYCDDDFSLYDSGLVYVVYDKDYSEIQDVNVCDFDGGNKISIFDKWVLN